MNLLKLFKKEEPKKMSPMESMRLDLNQAKSDSQSAMFIFTSVKEDLEDANERIETLKEQAELEMDAVRAEYERRVAELDELDVSLTTTHAKNEKTINNIKAIVG